MPTGHLMVGLMGGIAAVAAALLAGLPLWAAALLYVGLGNLCLLASVAVQFLRDRHRRGPGRRTGGPARAARRSLVLRPVRLDH